MKIIYPGTFDPLTNGHLDLIQRASKIFSEVHVAVSLHPRKKTLFTAEERKSLIDQSIATNDNVRVEIFDELLVDYAKKIGILQVLRGLRVASDFEYEFQMALMNRTIASMVEFFYLMPSQKFTFLSSTLVKEIASYRGPIEGFVPAPVVNALRKKF